MAKAVAKSARYDRRLRVGMGTESLDAVADHGSPMGRVVHTGGWACSRAEGPSARVGKPNRAVGEICAPGCGAPLEKVGPEKGIRSVTAADHQGIRRQAFPEQAEGAAWLPWQAPHAHIQSGRLGIRAQPHTVRKHSTIPPGGPYSPADGVSKQGCRTNRYKSIFQGCGSDPATDLCGTAGSSRISGVANRASSRPAGWIRMLMHLQAHRLVGGRQGVVTEVGVNVSAPRAACAERAARERALCGARMRAAVCTDFGATPWGDAVGGLQGGEA